MIQKKVYKKDELKKDVTSELVVDVESFTDDLATWLVKYFIDHDYPRNVKRNYSS